MCDCLLENPIVTSHTKRIEPPPENESWLEKLDREGNLENFVLGCFTIFGLIFISGIVIIILCRLQKREPQRVRLSFEPAIYINLEEKTKVRNKDIVERINDIQKNGYKPKTKKGKDDMFVINEVIEVGGEKVDQHQFSSMNNSLAEIE